MNGGKMIGTVLALMIAGIKRISQVFGGFKSVDMLEIHAILKALIFCRYKADYIRNFEENNIKAGGAV